VATGAEGVQVQRLEDLIDIGIALSAETSLPRLLEKILDSAIRLTNADGGSFYTVGKDKDVVRIEIMHNTSLGIRVGGTEPPTGPAPTVPLFFPGGTPNLNNVVTYAYHQNITVNIADSRDTHRFDFSGTRSFDEQAGYASVSFLTVPLRDHENEIIGVLQLINALDRETGKPIPFDPTTQRLTEALASQAASALTKEELIDAMKTLFEAIIQLIADAIDKKSPYTGGHGRRVPELAMMLADAADQCEDGPMAVFRMSDTERYALKIAGWLHDCGKITTPEYVVDKATKLETIFDRVHLVDARIEILKRDQELAWLRQKLRDHGVDPGDGADLSQQPPELAAFCQEMEADREFLHGANLGGEFMRPEDQERVREIAKRRYTQNGTVVPMLSENEVYNLNIARGTLTPEEREIINNHIRVTIDMLSALPFPKHLRSVTEFAGGHHERMDGKGYPRGLKRDELSVEARILGIADVFEALTASDRPYKKAKKLSESLKIMVMMKNEGHIDPDLFYVFLHQHVYLQYAEKFLDPAQIDEIPEKIFNG
jgi:HD-GYP domain-containing protein (c-di-GMP phosphodiesterase class II)